MLSKEGINRAVSRIALMNFFPASDPNARAVIIEEIISICESDAQAMWLARRMSQVFAEWPGLTEMRALFCKRFRPADGLEVTSQIFPSGFPSEQELGELHIEGLPVARKPLAIVPKSDEMKRLPAPSLEILDELVKSTAMPEPKRPRTAAEIEAELYNRK